MYAYNFNSSSSWSDFSITLSPGQSYTTSRIESGDWESTFQLRWGWGPNPSNYEFVENSPIYDTSSPACP